MMILLGTFINALCIIIGSLLGHILKRIPDSIKTTVMHGIGLVVLVLGLQMALKSENYLIVIISIVLGSILGESWRLDDKLHALGRMLERKIGVKGQGNLANGFVTATLIFVIGAMAIIGALDSGIRGDHQVLYTKGIIDGFTSLVLTTSLGIGVIFAVIPVVLYQGLIALFATQINRFIPVEMMDTFIADMTSTGGIMIFAIGLNLLGLTKIKVANLLPSILIVSLIVALLHYL